MQSQFEFCFKGNRSYIQGPDIMTAILEYFSGQAVTDIDVKFNGICATNLNLVEGDECTDAKVNIGLSLDGKEKVFQLLEAETNIDCRYDYDEESLVKMTQLDMEGRQILLNGITGYSFYENVVAMNKCLLQRLYPEEQGKWYFTRIEQEEVISDDALITVKLIKNFNFRLTKSDVFIAAKKVGSVYFSMVRG